MDEAVDVGERCRTYQDVLLTHCKQDRAFCSYAFLAKRRLQPTSRLEDLHVGRPQLFTTLMCFFHAEHRSHSVDDPLAWHLIGPITGHKDVKQMSDKGKHC